MIRVAAFLAALAMAMLIVWALASHLVGARHSAPSAPHADIRRNFPDRDENETATRFLATAARLNEADLRAHREAMIDYIRKEVASPSAASEPPPERVAEFLARNAAVIRTMRAELASNPAPQWKQRANELIDAPEPEFVLDLHLFTMFATAALAEHADHHDAAAWTDLGAIWILAQSLWNRPETNSVLIALGGSRMVASIAPKLAAPPPRWWNDFLRFDPREPLARALEYRAWVVRERAERYPLGEPDNEIGFREVMRRAVEPLVRPIRVIDADQGAAHIREIARAIGSGDPCNAASPSLRGWRGTVQRLNRFMIEREGAARVLTIEQQRSASGGWPSQIDEHSICSQARWRYQRLNDGIELSFSRNMPPPQTMIVRPLVYRR